MISLNLRTKFLTITIGIILLMSCAIILFIHTNLKHRLTDELLKRGEIIALDIVRDSVTPILTENYYELTTIAHDHTESHSDIGYIFITGPDGRVLSHSFEGSFPKAFRKLGFLRKYTSRDIKLFDSKKSGSFFNLTTPVLKGDAGVVHIGLHAEPIKKAVNEVIVTLVIIIFIISVIGSAAAIFFVRLFSRPVLNLTRIAEMVGKGDLKHKAEDIPGDEIGRLAISFNRMVDNLKETKEINERNDWLKTGRNKLSEKMRGNPGVYDLSDTIIQFLAEYMDADMGAFYLLEEDGQVLKLAGSYAFTKGINYNKRINIKEGLAGQAAYTKKKISLTDVPEDYVRISSAGVSAVPKRLIITPVIYENESVGVIELAALNDFDDFKLEFLDSAMESIAIAIVSAQSRSKMGSLLQGPEQNGN